MRLWKDNQRTFASEVFPLTQSELFQILATKLPTGVVNFKDAAEILAPHIEFQSNDSIWDSAVALVRFHSYLSGANVSPDNICMLPASQMATLMSTIGLAVRRAIELDTSRMPH